MNRSNLEQAGIRVAEAITFINRNEYPQLWNMLDAAWTLIDEQVDYEREALKWEEN